MAKTEIDVIIKGKDQASGVLGKISQSVNRLGIAMTAIGVAGLAMVQSSKGINAQLSVTAHSLNVSTKEMRDLTLATTNVTFPIDEVTASFDLLARAGVEDMEVMREVATAFDTLGDAIGQPASQVTGVLVPTMRTFRLSAEEMAGKTDMLAHMVRNSTISLDDFNTMVGYTSQDMVDAGLTVEDMAAAMIYMSDKGVAPGKVMLREWNKAVTKSEKEGIALTEALGMTSSELETYQDRMKDATGLSQELADRQNEQYTIMDKLKQKWSEITLKASGFLEPLEPLLAGMTALGPLMIVLTSSAGMAAVEWAKSTVALKAHTINLKAHKVASFASAVAMKVVAAAQWLWNAAMTANPIGLVIAAIAALIAIGVLLWKNWDKVVAGLGVAWEKIKEGFEKVKDFFAGVWEGIVKLFKKHWDKILAILFPAVGIVVLVARNWDKVVGFFKGMWGSIVGFFDNAWDTIRAGFFSGVNFVIDQLNKLIKAANKIVGWTGITIDEIEHVGASSSPERGASSAESVPQRAPVPDQFATNYREQVEEPARAASTSLVSSPQSWQDYQEQLDLAATKEQKLADAASSPQLWQDYQEQLDLTAAKEQKLADAAVKVTADAAVVEALKPKRALGRLRVAAEEDILGLAYYGFQSGGIVTSPTRAIIGEAGPEAVIPLRHAGLGDVFNITVQGSVWAMEDLVSQLRVEFLKIKADNTTTGF